MSDGGVGGGLSYWATISIKGNLSRDQLREVVREIRALLDKKITKETGGNPPVLGSTGDEILGDIVHATRLANTSEPELTITAKEKRDTI